MPDAKQLKFYRYLVVYPELGVVYPAKTKIEADEMMGEQSPSEAFVVDARWDDDSRLFWSSSEVGHPITSAFFMKKLK